MSVGVGTNLGLELRSLENLFGRVVGVALIPDGASAPVPTACTADLRICSFRA